MPQHPVPERTGAHVSMKGDDDTIEFMTSTHPQTTAAMEQ